MTLARGEKLRREAIKAAQEFKRIAWRCDLAIKRVERELRHGRLGMAVSELLFVEMYRTDATKLHLSRAMSMKRHAWLNGPIRKITGRVIRAVNDHSPERVKSSVLDTFC